MKIDILVLNYNGETLIPQCLPSIIEAKLFSKNDVTVTVIDNESRDGSIRVLESYGDRIDIIPHENMVFCSFNDVAARSDCDVLILLNNDIKVEPDFVDPLADIFMKYPDAFLAGPKVLTFDKKGYEGTRARWRIDKGVFKSNSRFDGYEYLIDKPGYTVQAGYGAFSRKKFLELGGFDDLYLPGIMEDADLCYRAWKKGYRGYYEPRSVMYHIGQASFRSAFGMYKIHKLSHRNTYLFMWKNITDAGILIKNILWLVPRMVFALVRGRFEIPAGFFEALFRLPAAVKRRALAVKEFRRSDKEVLEAGL